MQINLNKFSSQAEELKFRNPSVYADLIEYEHFTDEEINGLESMDFDVECYCTGCLESARLVEADGESGNCLCERCEFDGYIMKADMLYDSWKHGD